MATDKQKNVSVSIDISDNDMYAALKDIPGYLDITPGDLKEVFRSAYRHATERIASSVRAEEIMTTAVHTVMDDTLLKDVAELMAEKGISGLPVIDQSGRVIGIISEKDFLSAMGEKEHSSVMRIITECLYGKGCRAAPMRQKTARDMMTSPAITIPPDLPIFQIMELFSSEGINRAPVVDRNGVLAGIISRADIIRASVIKP